PRPQGVRRGCRGPPLCAHAETTHAAQRKRRGCIQLVAGPPQVLPCRLCRARPDPHGRGKCARQSRNELYASAPPPTSAPKIAVFRVAERTTAARAAMPQKNATFASRNELAGARAETPRSTRSSATSRKTRTRGVSVLRRFAVFS